MKKNLMKKRNKYVPLHEMFPLAKEEVEEMSRAVKNTPNATHIR